MFSSENIPDGVWGQFSGLPEKICSWHAADCSLAPSSAGTTEQWAALPNASPLTLNTNFYRGADKFLA